MPTTWTAALLLLLLAWPAAAGAADPDPRLARGQALYASHCAVCHGEAGDGNGPAAHMFRVRPRDFRQGLYKFRSTPYGALPTDDDLLRTVRNGLRWTGMLGHADLSDADGRALVAYVEAFSPRFAGERRAHPVAVPAEPATSDAVVKRGADLYRGQCAVCHGAHARGDGPAGTGLKDSWGWLTRPSDLTWRPLKRGSDPRDIYLTIVTGLEGTPMPSFAALAGNDAWALVAYLDTLVLADHRPSPNQPLGEERTGEMAMHMGHMHGGMGGMMMHGGPMMRRPTP